MKCIKNTFFVFLSILSIPVSAQKNIRLISPDKRIEFSFTLTDNLPVYQVAFKGKTIITPSSLSLSFKKRGDFGKNLKINKVIYRKGEDKYSLVVGKTK